ncbi:hypothetical protein NE865_15855 [Phthorimaea operculella]|nr:hypothetical protein NE865_15855 [Phthorimaea operculella]
MVSKLKPATKQPTIRKKKSVEESSMASRIDYMNKMRAAVRTILVNSNATTILSHGGAGYVCAFCNDRFPDPADLKTHCAQHKNEFGRFMKLKNESNFYVKLDITLLRCDLCSTDIPTINQLVDHLNSIHNQNIFEEVKKRIFPFKFEGKEFRCCECPSIYHAFRPLQEHMHSHYSNFVCNICSAGFIIKGALRVHETTHQTGSFKCAHCPKHFDNMNKKRMHEKCVHVSDLRFKCGFCDERFNMIYTKEKHQTAVHGAEKPEYKCHACEKVLANRSSLRTHIQRHHLLQRLHQCPECDMKFFSPSELRKHMPKHTGSRDFKCDVCQKHSADRKR